MRLVIAHGLILCSLVGLAACSPAPQSAAPPPFVGAEKEFAPKPPSLETVLKAIAAEQQYSDPVEVATGPLDAATVQYEAPPPAPVAVPSAEVIEGLAQDLGGLSDQIGSVQDELDALQKEVAGLRKELPLQIDRVTADLRRENDRLRDELARSGDAGPVKPRVPSPEDDPESAAAAPAATEEAMAEADPEPGVAAPGPEVAVPEAPEDEPEIPAIVPERMAQAYAEAIAMRSDAAPSVFTSVREWGRSPEEAGRITPKAPSLKGMVGTVPPGSAPESLAALGRQMREQYGAYDNISIEVFDDPAAAQQFAEKRTKDVKHHVLTVSKDLKSERDAIVLRQDGQTIEITPKPAQ